MWAKIKAWIYGGVVAIIGFLLMLLHIKSKKIDALKKDIKKEKADNNVNKQSVTILENQIEKINKLDGSASSHNEMIEEWNK